MKRIVGTVVAFALCRFALAAGTAAVGTDAAEVFRGKVKSVEDGDSITVSLPKGGRRAVRLCGIDAPELGQTWGTESKMALNRRIFGREVTVEARGRDGDGRVLGRVSLGGEDISGWMISEGHAWWRKSVAEEGKPGKAWREDEKRWREAEKTAREEKRGLWSKAGPVNPRDWRKLRGK